MEGLKQKEAVVETGYNRETVREEAAEQLQQMLSEIEVPEYVPEEFKKIAALEILRDRIDTPESPNSLRHVAWALDGEMQDAIREINRHEFLRYQMDVRTHILAEVREAKSEAA